MNYMEREGHGTWKKKTLFKNKQGQKSSALQNKNQFIFRLIGKTHATTVSDNQEGAGGAL